MISNRKNRTHKWGQILNYQYCGKPMWGIPKE